MKFARLNDDLHKALQEFADAQRNLREDDPRINDAQARCDAIREEISLYVNAKSPLR